MAETGWRAYVASALVIVGPAGCTSGAPAHAVDGGPAWQVLAPLEVSNAETFSLSIGATGDAYAGTLAGTVLSSHDRGNTWTTSRVGGSDAQILAIVTVGQSEVYVAGVEQNYDVISNARALVAKSADRGTTWTVLSPGFTGALDTIESDARGLFVAGADPGGGLFARSGDGGSTWEATLVPGTACVNGAFVSSVGDIYLVASAAAASSDAGTGDGGGDVTSDGAGVEEGGGLVLRSRDGGASWAVLATSAHVLGGISGTPDGTRIVAIGDGFTVLESRDQGATWAAGSEAFLGAIDGLGTRSIWVPDATSDVYAATGAAGLVRLSSPASGPSLQAEQEIILGSSPITVVAGAAATEVWAAGQGLIVRKALD